MANPVAQDAVSQCQLTHKPPRGSGCRTFGRLELKVLHNGDHHRFDNDMTPPANVNGIRHRFMEKW
jgi:hypothetical protein